LNINILSALKKCFQKLGVRMRLSKMSQIARGLNLDGLDVSLMEEKFTHGIIHAREVEEKGFV
jgi:hypothetical protein